MDFNLLIARVKNILLTPKTEWPVIASEPATVADIYKNYVIWLAAIGPIAAFIGQAAFGVSIPFVGTYRPSVGTLILPLILTYAVSLGMVYLLALVIDALAPTFGGEKNFIQALKTSAYGYTASFVAGIFGIVPALAILGLVGGIYSIYLFYIALPITMRNPPEKSVGYLVTVALIGIVLSVVLFAVVGSITAAGMRSGLAGSNPVTAPSFEPNTDSALGRIAAMGAQMEAQGAKIEAANAAAEAARARGDSAGAAAASAQAASAALAAMAGGNAGARALAPDELKPYLPDSLAGMPRASLNSSRNAAMGMEVSTVTGRYGEGSRQLEVEIVDMAGAPNFLALAGMAGMDMENESDTRVEKSYRRDGNWMHETWQRDGSSSEVQMSVGDRFMVKLSGTGVDIETVKRSMSELDLARLSSVAKG